MKKILLSNHYEGAPLEILEEVVGGDFELVVLDELSADELKAKIADADYLLVSGRLKVSGEVLACARNLKMIQRTGVGLDNMDLASIEAQGIPLYVNQGVNSTSVAEHTLYLMLAALRRSFFVNRQIRNGVWKKQETGLTTHELHGKTVGIIGMGNIGQRVVRLLAPFGVRVLYFSIPRLSPEEEEALGVEFRPFEDVLKAADIVSLHCPATGDGPMIGRAELQAMKDGAIVVNTARGGLVDMEALADALKSGKLSAAGIDVYDVEPVPADHPILGCADAVLSPHTAGVTYEAFKSMMDAAVGNIRLFDCGDLEAIGESRYL